MAEMKIRSGSNWIDGVLKVYQGGSFVEPKGGYIYTGGKWENFLVEPPPPAPTIVSASYGYNPMMDTYTVVIEIENPDGVYDSLGYKVTNSQEGSTDNDFRISGNPIIENGTIKGTWGYTSTFANYNWGSWIEIDVCGIVNNEQSPPTHYGRLST